MTDEPRLHDQPLRFHARRVHWLRGDPPGFSLLHTPLMSLTNALDAIAVVGAIILVGEGKSTLGIVFGTIAIVAAMSNVVGGFLITDRMLRMFKASTSKR